MCKMLSEINNLVPVTRQMAGTEKVIYANNARR